MSRIAALEKPSMLAKIVFLYSKREFGKVLSGFRILYSRLPFLALPHAQLYSGAEKKLSLPKRIALLTKIYTSMLNGCDFCADLHKFEAQRDGLPVNVARELANYKSSDVFSAKEKAALHFIEVTHEDLHLDDVQFAELKEHFSDQELMELTWLTAFTRYFNAIAGPLGLNSEGICQLNFGNPSAYIEDRKEPYGEPAQLRV